MNLLELLNPSNTQAAPAWRGTWARLWVQPSIFSPQSFIIGLALMDERGLCDYKLISDTQKFECIYGDSGRTVVEQLLAETRQRLGAAREKHQTVTSNQMPPGIKLDPVGYIAAASVSEALEEALNEAEIPMEPSPEEAKAPRFRSRKAEEVTEDIINAIRNKMGLDAGKILREDYFGDERHVAKVNLVMPKAVGMLTSGWYTDPNRVQLELLKAVTAVETYTAQNKKEDPPGVFFLRPTVESGLRPAQSEAIENAIDAIDWQLGRKGLRVCVREYEHELANDVQEWAKLG